jgi:hypothetical protein
MPTTANAYRRYAQECIQSAREAKSEPVRKQFLDLAKLWLTSAERMDAQPASPSQPIIKLDGHAPPNPGVIRDPS